LWTSGFGRGVNVTCTLLGLYAA